MKKIGIMTFYKNNINYGGMLQSYALQRAVQKLVGESGECVQISYTISPTPIKEKLKHSLQYRSFAENAKMVCNRLKACFNKRKKTLDSTARINAFRQFEAIIPHTEKIYTYNTVEDCAEMFTHLITGSDQVWNGGIDLDAFCLGFAKRDTKRISYAASSASTKFGKWQDEIFKKNLPKFTAISVREKSVIPYFEQMSGKKVSVVLDPVFLLSAADWHEIVQEPHIKTPYIFCYLLGSNKEWHERAIKIAKENSCKLVTIPYLNGYNQLDDNFGDIQISAASPQEFLGLIENAAGVVTDSFHATAFSIIFNRPFWALSRFKNQGKTNNNHRVTDILEQSGLLNCYENSSNKLSTPDYSNANKILKVQADKSYEFLKAALGDIEC